MKEKSIEIDYFQYSSEPFLHQLSRVKSRSENVNALIPWTVISKGVQGSCERAPTVRQASECFGSTSTCIVSFSLIIDVHAKQETYTCIKTCAFKIISAHLPQYIVQIGGRFETSLSLQLISRPTTSQVAPRG